MRQPLGQTRRSREIVIIGASAALVHIDERLIYVLFYRDNLACGGRWSSTGLETMFWSICMVARWPGRYHNRLIAMGSVVTRLFRLKVLVLDSSREIGLS